MNKVIAHYWHGYDNLTIKYGSSFSMVVEYSIHGRPYMIITTPMVFHEEDSWGDQYRVAFLNDIDYWSFREVMLFREPVVSL